MIKWFKRNEGNSESKELLDSLSPTSESGALPEEEVTSDALPTSGIFKRFKQGLSKTRHHLGDSIGRLFLGKKEIAPDVLEELETLLVSADVGLNATNRVIQRLSDGLARKELSDGDAVLMVLKNDLQALLTKNSNPLNFDAPASRPFVILMVGVNGAGKTTTIGKLARQYQLQGKSVMLAAGDTFRAAAVEQLQAWGKRNQVPVVAQQMGADSASVIYDALQSAQAKGIDILIADTAGRLHTQQNLMEELKKVKRVLKKIDPTAPHETMLILDASIGQNALNQARQFHQAIELTGITMTKLDGTAKGGILFAIANELEIPFRYIGIGEGIDDLRAFDASHFVNAIFNDDSI